MLLQSLEIRVVTPSYTVVIHQENWSVWSQQIFQKWSFVPGNDFVQDNPTGKTISQLFSQLLPPSSGRMPWEKHKQTPKALRPPPKTGSVIGFTSRTVRTSTNPRAEAARCVIKYLLLLVRLSDRCCMLIAREELIWRYSDPPGDKINEIVWSWRCVSYFGVNSNRREISRGVKWPEEWFRAAGCLQLNTFWVVCVSSFHFIVDAPMASDCHLRGMQCLRDAPSLSHIWKSIQLTKQSTKSRVLNNNRGTAERILPS